MFLDNVQILKVSDLLYSGTCKLVPANSFEIYFFLDVVIVVKKSMTLTRPRQTHESLDYATSCQYLFGKWRLYC